MIYRVKISNTGSKQPSGSSTYWREEVVYCGTDATEARIAYHENKPLDFSGGYGNPARVTEFERLDDSRLAEDDPGDDDDWNAVI